MIAALAGISPVWTALAAPVDLWRINVQSRQGQPLRASARLTALPQEHLTDACLSLGTLTDAPGSDLPLLQSAQLRLDASGTVVEIRTEEAIQVPALAMTLRVQCPGTPLYARHFRVLIPPGESLTPDLTPTGRGFHLRLRPGDTVETVAAALFPSQPRLRQIMVTEVIAGNPSHFPDGRIRDVAPGTLLWFPDLHDLGKSIRPSPAPNAPMRQPVHMASVGHATIAGAPLPPKAQMRVAARTPNQRRSPESAGTLGPRDCGQPLSRGADSAVVVASPELEERTLGLESGLTQLRQDQAGLDLQVTGLEQSLQRLQKAVAAVQTCPAIPTPPLPAVPVPGLEISTMAKTQPTPWYFWIGSAALAMVTAAAGFAFARRSYPHSFAKDDEPVKPSRPAFADTEGKINSTFSPDELSAPRPVTHSRSGPSVVADAPPHKSNDRSLDRQFDARRPSPTLPAVQDPPSTPQISSARLSRELLHELDQALDMTQSMFNDVDRFIALGRTKNALSLLEFQVQKSPDDRNIWIKLMAVYRQAKMNAELEQTAREFQQHFSPDR